MGEPRYTPIVIGETPEGNHAQTSFVAPTFNEANEFGSEIIEHNFVLFLDIFFQKTLTCFMRLHHH